MNQAEKRPSPPISNTEELVKDPSNDDMHGNAQEKHPTVVPDKDVPTANLSIDNDDPGVSSVHA